MTVFSSIESANLWRNSGSWRGKQLMVVPCLVKNPLKGNGGIPLIPVLGWDDEIQTKVLRAFWNAFNKYNKRFGVRSNMPKVVEFMRRVKGVFVHRTHYSGVLCDAVKCLE